MENLKNSLKERANCVTPCFYYFDNNKRVYEKDGVITNSQNYEKHFIKIQILEETDKEYICQYGRTINKRSMLYKIDSSTRTKIYTEQEKEDKVYVNSKAHSLAELVRKSDANTLREVERLLFQNKV